MSRTLNLDILITVRDHPCVATSEFLESYAELRFETIEDLDAFVTALCYHAQSRRGHVMGQISTGLSWKAPRVTARVPYALLDETAAKGLRGEPKVRRPVVDDDEDEDD
jgi:hypothetical protein